LSPIEFLVLAHLRSRELRNRENVGQYGYEMIQELNEMFAGSWEAKSGTIYPILTKLDNVKHLLMEDIKQSQLGPVKKIYILTEAGRKLVDQVIRERFESDIDFMLHYIELLTPFVMMFDQQDESAGYFDKLMAIPVKFHALTLDHVVT
jgi:DNA-binding PadR family transcriptional regulator